MRRRKSRGLAVFHPQIGTGHDTGDLLKAAGLERDAKRMRSLQARSMAAYEAGRLAEGDRLAATADTLGEKIESTLLALDEEYDEGMHDTPAQSVTRFMAEAWNECMNPRWPSECRRHVEEYRRTGHGEWQPPQMLFVGPPNRWIGLRTSAEAVRQAAEHPEWYEHRPGYYMDPGLVHSLRELVGDPNAEPFALLDAAEEAWNTIHATTERIRAGVASRRMAGIDPMEEAKRFVRTSRRRRKRTSRNPRRRR
jgi:hypothetical protein